MDLLALFCNYHPNFMSRLNSFPETSHNRLLKKLKTAKNRASFRSTISEIRFGEFFKRLNFEIEYDRKINNQTPDWTLNYSTSPIICDVYRLGQSSHDQERSDFENLLKEQLEKIASNYVIKINIDENYRSYEESQIWFLKEKLEIWLKDKPKLNDKLFFDYDFTFKVIAKIPKKKFLSCIIFNMIDYKIGKVQQAEHQRPNEITKKMQKYTELIISQKLPFFICVDIDFASGFTHEEFEEYFLGSSVGFIDYSPEVKISTDIGVLGSEWTSLGKFYENSQISGVITCLNNSYKVLLNPIRKQVIFEDQYKNFLSKLMKYSDDN